MKINLKIIISFFLIFLICLINKILSNDLKNNINQLITLFYLYNPYIKNYDYLINSNIYNANSFIYSNTFEYGFSLSNIPYRYILPTQNEPMTSYTLMYSITNTNKNKIKSNIEYTLKQNEIIKIEKQIYLLNSSYELKKALVNIYFLNTKQQVLNEIIKEFLKIKETISLNYTYNKAKLSDLLIIEKELSSLQIEINSINLEITDNLQTINSFLPLPQTQLINITNQITQITQEDLNQITNIIYNFDNLYNNPYLLKIQKEKELVYYEIYKELNSKLPDNKFSIEYLIRPHLDHILMIKYSIMFENKNMYSNKIKALYQKINSLNTEYQNQLLKNQSNYNYIISQLKNLSILLTNISEEQIKQEKYIKSLLIEYSYNKSNLLDIYLAYKELLNLKLKKIEIENKIYNLVIEYQTLKGVIFYE